MTVTSIVTPTNGATAPLASDKAAKAAATKAANAAAKATKAAKAAALLSTAIPEMVGVVTPTDTAIPATAIPAALLSTTAIPAMVAAPISAEQAITAAYNYGASMAGLDGVYTNALKQFKDNESVLESMTVALNLGYLVRKLGVDKAEAERIFGLKKHNPEKEQDDEHRTVEQQRIMDSVRVMLHRANKLAGIVKAKSEAQVTAELKRAVTESERDERESRLIAADAVIHPDKTVDVNTAMVRYVAAMRNYHNGHANLFVGDSGMAWRDWLSAAPIPKIN